MPIPAAPTPPPSGSPRKSSIPAPVAAVAQSGPSKPAAYGPDRFDPVALILACVLPGLGHWYLGEKQRAGLIAAGVLGLFFGGILIGGIDVIDRKEDTIWFVGEALVGPVAFGVDYLHQNTFKVRSPSPQGSPGWGQPVRSANPDETRDPATGGPLTAAPGQLPPSSKSLGRMNELGTLFATIAGMLNLIVIIDAAAHGRRKS